MGLKQCEEKLLNTEGKIFCYGKKFRNTIITFVIEMCPNK